MKLKIYKDGRLAKLSTGRIYAKVMIVEFIRDDLRPFGREIVLGMVDCFEPR